ncbi:hypothetical protein FQN54_001563 [Arachnomyces sp. PD_36]|nr:hypothetical protein FQN54_001563 [Arachnomyces sp. PD_36]
MSRRMNPGADRAAQNQQTIKSLLKLECNKICADCKKNKHPRWASWNLGVFVCIRCSGIHRGMGTHISRVKSVDLDAWTDEQLQSILKWGNARANKYWESKLAAGHVPSDAKMENFIRTKYESKRWVMDGPMPDPSTLDTDGDDDVPLAVVQEKAKLDRSASQRTSSTTSQPPPRRQQPQTMDFFADDTPAPPARPSTTDPPGLRAPPRAPESSNKQNKPADSLLGLDFFGSTQSATTSRPSSTTPNSTGSGPSRPDLKQSILSLYASAPKPQSPPAQHERNSSFGSLTSPQLQSHSQGLTDAFSGLSFPSTTSPPPQKQQAKPSAFSNLGSMSSTKSTPAAPHVASPSLSSGGGFFDSQPAPKAAPKPQQQRTQSTSSNGLDFSFVTAAKPAAPSKPAAPPATSNDLFDMSSAMSPPATTFPPPATTSPPASELNSAFNLSAPKKEPASQPPPPAVSANLFSGNMDPWGSDAWSTPEPAPAPKAPASTMAMKVPDTITANDVGSAWGKPAPKPQPTVSADEDFGGWTSAPPAVPSGMNNSSSTKPAGGFPANDDLFSNVWE